MNAKSRARTLVRAGPKGIHPMPVVADGDIGRKPMPWRAKKGRSVSKNSEKKDVNFSSILCAECLNSRAQGKMDNIIEAKELQIERKHFYVELRENERGRFLRITEEAHGRRNSIIVPSTGVEEFTATIADVLTNGETAPA